MSQKFTFNINNNLTLEMMQPQHDDTVFISEYKDDPNHENWIYSIPNGDMVMLLNMYQFIKNNNIHNDFVNPYGEIPSGEIIYNKERNDITIKNLLNELKKLATYKEFENIIQNLFTKDEYKQYTV